MEAGPMSELTPTSPSDPTRFTAEQYLRLVEEGVLSEEDRVELLEGVIVAMTPSNPRHASYVTRVARIVRAAMGANVTDRSQLALLCGALSVPEPDLAVVPGHDLDYVSRHPDRACLVVEVSDSSVAQDRLSKSRIYAAASVPEYWIVNLRDGLLEVHRDPDPAHAVYRSVRRLSRGERIRPGAYESAEIDVSALVPPPGTA